MNISTHSQTARCYTKASHAHSVMSLQTMLYLYMRLKPFLILRLGHEETHQASNISNSISIYCSVLPRIFYVLPF